MARLATILLSVLLLASCQGTGPVADALLAGSSDPAVSLEMAEEAYLSYPDDSRVLYNYAYMLLSQGDEDGAIKVADEGLAMDPTSLRFNYLKASALRSQGRLRSWEALMEDVLSFDPANIEALSALASFNETFFHHDRAVEYAKRVLYYEPTNQAALGILAKDDAYFASLASTSVEAVWTDPDRITAPTIPPHDIDSALADLASGKERRTGTEERRGYGLKEPGHPAQEAVESTGDFDEGTLLEE